MTGFAPAAPRMWLRRLQLLSSRSMITRITSALRGRCVTYKLAGAHLCGRKKEHEASRSPGSTLHLQRAFQSTCRASWMRTTDYN